MLIYHCMNAWTTLQDVSNGAQSFFLRHNIKPDKVYIKMHDLQGMMPAQVVSLETGKQYGMFLQTPAGIVEIVPMEGTEYDVATSAPVVSNGTAPLATVVFKNTVIDKEFEKHVLNG